MTDYCTFWFEGWWAHCCKAHDDAYLAQAGKALADSDLLLCVAQSAPAPILAGVSAVIAGAMYAAVRVFGQRFYNKAPPL